MVVAGVIVALGGASAACSRGSSLDSSWATEVSERLPDPAVRGPEAFGSQEEADLVGRFLEISVSAFPSRTELSEQQCRDLLDSLRSDAPAEDLFRAAASIRDRALSQLVLNARQQVGAYLTRCTGNEGATGSPDRTGAPGTSIDIVRESLKLAAGRYQEVVR